MPRRNGYDSIPEDDDGLMRTKINQVIALLFGSVTITIIILFTITRSFTSTNDIIDSSNYILLSKHTHHHYHHNRWKKKQHHDMNTPLFYEKQLIDHYGDDSMKHWKHRYYKSTEHWRGPGWPILLVVGGERAMNNGMLYPFVTDVLAKRFSAAVIQAEHRFYGPYQPLKFPSSIANKLELFTPAQAMEDMRRLVMIGLRENGQDFVDCSPHRSSKSYCPLVTVGASYSGFLSAMFRLLHSDVVDMAYASSAPLLMYGQITDNREYYNMLTRAVDRTIPGCAHAVKSTLLEVTRLIRNLTSVNDAALAIGVCDGKNLPVAFYTTKDLANGLNRMIANAFVNNNAGVYKSGYNVLYKVCQPFQDITMNSVDRIKAYFIEQAIADYENSNSCEVSSYSSNICHKRAKEKYLKDMIEGKCKDMRPDIGPGPYYDRGNRNKLTKFDGRVYDDQDSYKFQTCTNLISLSSRGNESMFPNHLTTYDEVTRDCHHTYGPEIGKIRPTELVDMWHFAPAKAFVNTGVSRIIFVNGMNDMWSKGAYSENVSDTVLVVNMINAKHHSDLTYTNIKYNEEHDTEDVKDAKEKIAYILETWLQAVKLEAAQ